MSNKPGSNGVNQELPDEHEVIQHGVRESSDKRNQTKPVLTNNPPVKKPDDSSVDDAARSPDAVSRKK